MYSIHPLWQQFPCAGKTVQQGTELASYYNSQLNKTVRFKLISKADLPLFCQWMNDPRVAHFWQQAWSEEKQWQYLSERLADNYSLPLIMYFDEQPFGYVEVYWAELDKLAGYYEWQPKDRGIHLLVGEQSCRGPENFRAWMTSLSHLIYLGHEDTQRIVLEPRHDNARLLTRIAELGYHSQFEFDFPHKRAALVMAEKASFYRDVFPQFA
ncbi:MULTISPECIES: GNAT family N-acetyltransferase [Pseudoalteromonas]|uniref:GNAT family N-acetyltransferase n=1 Tax=Pseudoalteromonas TaxID=53246 RepID=UPI000FFF3116|nr:MULTISPECIES: GNAT family N-acetyltransferase [Pseudoalteromonas]NKC19681.1 GNAT family N-acetyltransferase [Pseudoalteromonas galatheae]RXE86834.1 N-acetyltransferase [Pseudoalteromonas sp. A757]